MSHHEFTTLPRNRLRMVAKHKHLVLYDTQMTAYRFDAPGLQSIFSDALLPFVGTWSETCLEPKQAYEVGRLTDATCGSGKQALGAVDLLVASANDPEGNIMGTQRVRLPLSDHLPPMSMAGDLVSWQHTLGAPHCKPGPLSDLFTRWATAATPHLLNKWAVDHYGFTTYINVSAGSAWVVVANPRAGMNQGYHLMHAYCEPFDPSSRDSALWEIEAILLPSKSQM